MNVVFCTFDLPHFTAGPNVWLLRLLPDLLARGFRIRVLVLARSATDQAVVAALRGKGIECRVTVWPRYTEHAVQWMLRDLAADPPDVFVPNCLVPGFFAARWAREAGIPTVAVMHSDDRFHWGLYEQFAASRSDYRAYRLSALVCVSRFLREQVAARGPADVLLPLIPYGVPPGPAKDFGTPDNGASRGAMRLVYVGRLVEEQKRISDTARALCRAVREVPGTEAVLYGNGPDEGNLRRVLRTQGRGLPIRFAGPVENERLYDHLREAHVMVLLSDYEGMGIILIEAMACGVVPVCLDIPAGYREAVEDGVTGLLVKDRGEDFVAAVRRLREEPGLWRRLSEAGRARVEERYLAGACSGRWADLLEQLHAGAGPRTAPVVPSEAELMALPPVRPGLSREDVRIPRGIEKVLRPLYNAARFPDRAARRILHGLRQ